MGYGFSRLFRDLLITMVLAVALVAIAAASVLYPIKLSVGYYESLPSRVVVVETPQRSHVYASDGKTLLAVFYAENRQDTTLDQVSPWFVRSLLAAEDLDFYSHRGVDFKGIARSFVSNLKGEDTQGASTITMQYVRQALIYSAKSEEEIEQATENTINRKIREVKYAVELENNLSKDEILERYMNIIAFGNTAYGIYTASEVYFGKHPSKLTLPEASLLAGIINAPTEYNPATKEGYKLALDRREYVLAQMLKANMITQEQYDSAKATKPKISGKPTSSGCIDAMPKLGGGFFCDYFARWWQQQEQFGSNAESRMNNLNTGGYTIISTLDVKVQKAANYHVKDQVSIKNRNANMIAVVEPGTGYVKSLAINRIYSNDTSKNGKHSNPKIKGKGNYPNTTVPFITGNDDYPGYQAGSTFKIFTVVAALEQGFDPNKPYKVPDRVRTNYVVSANSPAACPGTNYYCPSNAASGMGGTHTLYTAFGASVNTFFIPLQEMIGAERSVDVAKRMGIKFRASGSKNNPSDKEFANDPKLAHNWGPFSLGVSSVTPLELASAYATIAADGVYCEPSPAISMKDKKGKVTKFSPKCEKVLAKSVARDAMDIARCPVGGEAKYGKCGSATAGDTRRIVGKTISGKTGTTDGDRVASFVVTTNKLTVAGMLADPDWAQTYRSVSHYPVNTAVSRTMRDSLK